MPTRYADLGKKMLSLALTFNSLVSMIWVGSVMAGYYAPRPWWQLHAPYSPYFLHGSFFAIAFLTAFLNIIPSRMIGKVHINRFLFHHYVYGFLVMICSIFLIASFWPEPLTSLFTPTSGTNLSNQSLIFYTELFFLYGGLTLFLDDLPDVSLRISSILSRLKERTKKSGKTLQFVHLSGSLITIYLSLAVSAWFIEAYFWIRQWPTSFLSYLILILSLTVNGIWGLSVTRKKTWFQS